MPIYVIHIGPPKTGSTLLQSSLRDWRYKLRDHAVHYQSTLGNKSPQMNHEWMLRALKTLPNPQLEDAFSKLNQSDFRYVVLSSEGFFGLSTEQLKYVRQLVAGSPVQIVYYCRRWSERIPSQWKQMIKMGSYATFPEHYLKELRDPASFLDLNPKLVWDRFAEVFGRNSIRLISFNGLVERKLDICEHFLAQILQVPPMPRPERFSANESPNMIDTEVIRALNYIHVQNAGAVPPAMRVALTNFAGSTELDELKQMMAEDLGTVIVNDEAGPFRDIYAQMLQYRDCLVPFPQESGFFRLQALRLNYIRQNYLMREAASARLNKLYEILRPQQVAAEEPIAVG